MDDLGQFFINDAWGALLWSVLSSVVFAAIVGTGHFLKSQPLLVFDQKYGSKILLGFRVFKRLKWRAASMSAKRISIQIREEGLLPDMVIGIGRGGAVFGAMLSYSLAKCDEKGKKKNIPLTLLERDYADTSQGRVTRIVGDKNLLDEKDVDLKFILLVAGEGHTGETMIRAKSLIQEKVPQSKVKTCVFYDEEVKRGIAFDYAGVKGKGFNLMPWQDKATLRESYWNKCVVFVVRHGETDLNKEDRFVGTTDVELNETGRQQALRLGNDLKKYDITKIYSSPSKRCLQTAELIKKQMSCPNKISIEIKDNLKEMDFGDWEGMRRDDIRSLYASDYIHYQNDVNFMLPGSKESPKKVEKRTQRFLKTLVEYHERQRPFSSFMVVVTHKTTGRIMVNHILKENHKEKAHYRDIPMENASVAEVVFDDGFFKVSGKEVMHI